MNNGDLKLTKLSFEGFNRAREYLKDKGRDLEQALFDYHFWSGSSKPLLHAITAYQGDDGGFRNMGEGHRTFTTVMDTSMAFQYLSEVGAPSDHPVIQRGIQYIIDSYDRELKCWHPRHGQRMDSWCDNPNAEIVGYLYEYRGLVPTDFLESVTEQAIASIQNPPKPYHQHYFLEELCILRLAMRIGEPYRTGILKRMRSEIHELIETDPTKWATVYCAKPWFFAHSPNSPLFALVQTQVIQSLENEIETQAEAGNFVLNWSADEDSARIWKSIWTMDVLRALYRHKMIQIGE